MKYLVDKQEKYNIIQLREEKLDSTIAPMLKSELITFNAEGVRNIVLDLSMVKYADSSGLSSILVGNRLCVNDNGILVLCAISDHVRKLLDMSKLLSVLTVLPTIEEGIEAVFLNEIENSLRRDLSEN